MSSVFEPDAFSIRVNVLAVNRTFNVLLYLQCYTYSMSINDIFVLVVKLFLVPQRLSQLRFYTQLQYSGLVDPGCLAQVVCYLFSKRRNNTIIKTTAYPNFKSKLHLLQIPKAYLQPKSQQQPQSIEKTQPKLR